MSAIYKSKSGINIKLIILSSIWLIFIGCDACTSSAVASSESLSKVSRNQQYQVVHQDNADQVALKEISASNANVISKKSASVPVFMGAPLLVYKKKDAVWGANVNGSNAHVLFHEPDGYKFTGRIISPDGKMTVDTVEDEQHDYYVAVENVKSKERQIFHDIKGGRGRWSPDGQNIVFRLLEVAGWKLARISKNGKNYKAFESFKHECDTHNWSPKGIYCLSLSPRYMYLINPTSGEIIERWDLDDMLRELKHGLVSSMPLVPSKDGTKLLMVIKKSISSLPPSGPGVAFVFDTESKTIKQITSTKYNAGGVAWLPDEKGIVFSGEKLRMKDIRSKGFYRIKKSNLYRINLDGTGLKMIVKGADSPSISRGR